MAEKPKRRVKNPESFRERALKTAEYQNKPTKRSRTGTAAARPFKAIGKLFVGLFQIQPFKAIGKIFAVVGRFIGRIIFPKYFRNSWKELKQVSWPTRKESFALTYAVLLFAVVITLLVAGLDFVLSKLFKFVLLG